MFWAMFSLIVRSTWLYLQYLVVFTQVAAGWCPEILEIYYSKSAIHVSGDVFAHHQVTWGILLGRVTCGEQQVSREVCCRAELPVPNSKGHVRFAVSTTLLLKIHVFWHVTFRSNPWRRQYSPFEKTEHTNTTSHPSPPGWSVVCVVKLVNWLIC